jgi:hypothetical protein
MAKPSYRHGWSNQRKNQISRKPSVIVDVATESGCEHYDLFFSQKIGNL